MADAAAIEARGLAWIAGQDDLIAAFERDADIYSEFAAETLAAPCRKPRKDDPPIVAKVFGGRRALGKVGILGMGYGMGADRALEYMLTYPELAPKVESGEIDWNFCKRFVMTYREKYRMIPKFWYDLEAVFKYVTRYGKTAELRGLRLSREGITTILRLPSGRSLFYPYASLSGSGREERIKWKAGPVWADLWGGTVVENCVQSLARDILAEAILYIEDHGFRVAHHCYDSVVVSVPAEQQTLCYACVCEAFTKHHSAWSNGWPLGVEATVGRRYE
jgi:DNA polymerase